MKTRTTLNPNAAAFAAACAAIFQHRAMQIMRSATASENCPMEQNSAPPKTSENCPMEQNSAPPKKFFHFPTSHERTEALDLVKWIHARPKAEQPKSSGKIRRAA